jgi:tRNA (guanine-N7-)-methyltransferase
MTDERPDAAPLHARRFRPRAAEDYPRQDINPYLVEHLEYGPPVVTAEQAQGFRGRWADAFGRAAPLHVEVGPGNGFHLAGMAARHPAWNWLGIEIRFKRVMLCARKIEKAGAADQARIARYDAWSLDDVFAPGEIDGLYVFHPDPWSKARHGAKRLMSPAWLGWACRAVRPGGRIRIKTDHAPHMDAMEAALDGLPLRLHRRIDDVKAQGYPWPAEDDVVTNYESKFHKRGLPVHAALLERVPGAAPPAPPQGPPLDPRLGE